MQTLTLAGLPHSVSRAGLGGCPLGGHGWGAVDDQDSVRAVRKALELGVNFFDTADVYGLGHSETILAEALGSARSEVAIATKIGVRRNPQGTTWRDISPLYLREALEGSLRRLRLDCVPMVYLHWPDGRTPVEDAVAELENQRQRGKLLSIGVSNFSAEQLRRACETAPVAAVQVQFSLVDRAAIAELLPVARTAGVPVITWGSLAQGLLTGKFDRSATFAADDRRRRYENFSGPKFDANLHIVDRLKRVADRLGKTPGQVALRWLLDTPGVGAVLFGAKRPDQVIENAAAAEDWRLPENDYRELEAGEPVNVRRAG